MNEPVNPDMIVLAREARQLSQKDLADAIGVNQTKVSKFELGLLNVPEKDLDAIAEVTQYHTSLFRTREQIVGLGSSMLFNRKRETTPVALQKEVQAKVNITRIQLLRLLRSIQIESPYQFSRLDTDECGGPEGAAQRLRAAWNVPMGPIQSMTSIIESAGGIVVLCDFGTDKIDGAHLWVPGSPPMFFMNSKVSGDRHRFNLAHELGHAIMHEFPTGDIEAEANSFASSFLLPAHEISFEIGSNVTIEQLARMKQRWKVSMACIAVAARAIGQISEQRYRMLFTRLASLGYRRNEPIDIPMEQPTIIRQVVEYHRVQLGFTDNDMRGLLMTDYPDFLEMPDSFKIAPRVRIEGSPIPIAAYRSRKAE